MRERRRGLCLYFVTLACVLAGCANGPARAPFENRAPPNIELIGITGCPQTPALRANLRAALRSLGGGWRHAETDVETLPADDPRRGYPSPTILVNGRDLYGLPVPTTPLLACRVYAGGIPSAQDLAERIAATVGQ